jgi:fluoroacetyl-CoA thioesterase
VPPEPGSAAHLCHRVTAADTAAALGSGDVPVLGTPRVLALAEAATVAAVAGALADGQTTVGVRVDLEHLQPIGVGGLVSVSATLAEAHGRRLTFTVRVTDDGGRLVAAGRITRAVVDRDRFLSGG